MVLGMVAGPPGLWELGRTLGEPTSVIQLEFWGLVSWPLCHRTRPRAVILIWFLTNRPALPWGWDPQGPTIPNQLLIAFHTSSHLTSYILALMLKTARVSRGLWAPPFLAHPLPVPFLKQLGQIAERPKITESAGRVYTSSKERSLAVWGEQGGAEREQGWGSQGSLAQPPHTCWDRGSQTGMGRTTAYSTQEPRVRAQMRRKGDYRQAEGQTPASWPLGRNWRPVKRCNLQNSQHLLWSEGERETLNDSRTHTQEGSTWVGKRRGKLALLTLPRVSLPPPPIHCKGLCKWSLSQTPAHRDHAPSLLTSPTLQ